MADRIGEQLRTLRQKRGLSIRALATMAGVALSAISEVERGVRAGGNLTGTTLLKLAAALKVTLDELAAVSDDSC